MLSAPFLPLINAVNPYFSCTCGKRVFWIETINSLLSLTLLLTLVTPIMASHEPMRNLMG